MKKKKLEKKKRKRVRERDWEHAHETSFTHDRIKHRRALAKLPEHAPDEDLLPRDFEPNATVVSHAKKWAFVINDAELGSDEVILCRIDERLQEHDATLLAPGDRVLVEEDEGEPYVRGVAARRTKLSRVSAAYAGPGEQVFAANADALIVMTAAAKPAFKPGLVDRYLIAAQVGGVTPILCVNKMDLVDEPPEELALYRDLGVATFCFSCATGEGIDPVRDALRGKLSVLSGHSGVGKSSLLNAIDPHLQVYTQDVSDATNKGKHTTTAARLYVLDGDIRIIDTPGIRALGLWAISSEEVAHYFPEIAEHATGCRFSNCTHTHEPQCAVQDAVDAGEIPALRFASYLRIRASLESDRGITPGRMGAINPDALQGDA